MCCFSLWACVFFVVYVRLCVLSCKYVDFVYLGVCLCVRKRIYVCVFLCGCVCIYVFVFISLIMSRRPRTGDACVLCLRNLQINRFAQDLHSASLPSFKRFVCIQEKQTIRGILVGVR